MSVIPANAGIYTAPSQKRNGIRVSGNSFCGLVIDSRLRGNDDLGLWVTPEQKDLGDFILFLLKNNQVSGAL